MADNTTAGRTRKLTEFRRLDSADKTRRVLAALEATISAGQSLTIAALARHARVSRRFIYDHPELRAEAERRAAQAADRTAGAITASARITVASLRADLANAKATNHRQHTELEALRRRLGQVLTAAQPAELEQALSEVKEQLAQRDQELAAARQINRELIARLNRERTEPRPRT